MRHGSAIACEDSYCCSTAGHDSASTATTNRFSFPETPPPVVMKVAALGTASHFNPL